MKRYPIVRLPDDEPYRWWKLYPDTIVIHYGEALDTFLLLGKEKALLIDTAYGRGEFPNIIEELREGRELIVVNTHGHFDHTGGNFWYPEVHMHKKAMAYAKMPFAPIDEQWMRNMPYPDYGMVAIEDGHVFNLGDRLVETLYTPAHSDSSLSFIDHGRRLLFSGDEFDAGQANMFSEKAVEDFLNNMLRLKRRMDEYDFIMPNHNGCPVCNSYLDDFITAARHVVESQPDIVSREGLPQFKLGLVKMNIQRVRVGLSCINYPLDESKPFSSGRTVRQGGVARC